MEYGLKDVSEAAVRAKVLAAIDILAARDEEGRAGWLVKKLDVLRTAQRTGATPEDRAQAGNQLLGTVVNLAQTAEQAKQWAQAADWWQEAAATAKKIRPEAQADYRSRMEWARHFDAAAKQVAELTAKLKAKEDLVSRLLLLHVQTADLDDPGAATGNLTPDVPEIWRTQLPLARQKPDSLSIEACRELSRWYAGPVLKDCGNDFAKIVSLRRAAAGFNRILDDKTFTAAPERKAILAELGGIESQLVKLGVNVARPATIFICCDDEFTLYVNGRGVGQGWGHFNLQNFKVQLTGGDVIGVRGRDNNGGRSAGLFCTVEMRDRTLVSGKDWRCSVKAPANWAATGYAAGDRPVSVTNVAPEHKTRKFPNVPGQFMWTSELSGIVYFKLVVPK
ncbi:MAG: hypothetical protein NT031_11485 [Planctomycetota bacterium]|nr:hypothetical protein [Planctomycetota bacterium]